MRYYTEGRNVFGEKVETQFLKLTKKEYKGQIMKMMFGLSQGKEIEYTIDMDELNAKEKKDAELLMRKMMKVIAA